jgi:hypothetical protein
VEIVPGRSAAGMVIHLLNRSGDAAQRFTEPLPIAESWLALPWPGDWSVRALRAGRDLETTVEDGVTRVRLPVIGLFEVLVVTTILSNKYS